MLILMKILWLSNRVLSDQMNDRSGTWLFALANELSGLEHIILGNISVGKVSIVTRMDYNNIEQWIVPREKLRHNGLPSKRTIKGIQSAVREFSPDIIEIWGTEDYWGLLTARKILNGTTILNIQGVMFSIVPVFYGGLTVLEQLKCIGIKEIIRPTRSLYRIFQRKTKYEKEIIQAHENIIIQSTWTKAQVSSIKSTFICYDVERSLRAEIVRCQKWMDFHQKGTLPPILFTSSIGMPYKGLHVMIKSLALLKLKYPDVLLNIAGYYSPPGIRRSGYERWIRRLIKTQGLSCNVNWLGPINASELVKQLQQASIYINPSFVESYSLALAEAMYVGTPSVVAYSGAMPNLAKDEKTALFFTPGDYIYCAFQIERYLTSFSFASMISENAVVVAKERNDPESIVKCYINIYNEILSSDLKS